MANPLFQRPTSRATKMTASGLKLCVLLMLSIHPSCMAEPAGDKLKEIKPEDLVSLSKGRLSMDAAQTLVHKGDLNHSGGLDKAELHRLQRKAEEAAFGSGMLPPPSGFGSGMLPPPSGAFAMPPAIPSMSMGHEEGRQAMSMGMVPMQMMPMQMMPMNMMPMAMSEGVPMNGMVGMVPSMMPRVMTMPGGSMMPGGMVPGGMMPTSVMPGGMMPGRMMAMMPAEQGVHLEELKGTHGIPLSMRPPAPDAAYQQAAPEAPQGMQLMPALSYGAPGAQYAGQGMMVPGMFGMGGATPSMVENAEALAQQYIEPGDMPPMKEEDMKKMEEEAKKSGFKDAAEMMDKAKEVQKAELKKMYEAQMKQLEEYENYSKQYVSEYETAMEEQQKRQVAAYEEARRQQAEMMARLQEEQKAHPERFAAANATAPEAMTARQMALKAGAV